MGGVTWNFDPWIGLRENLQETMFFFPIIQGEDPWFPVKMLNKSMVFDGLTCMIHAGKESIEMIMC